MEDIINFITLLKNNNISELDDQLTKIKKNDIPCILYYSIKYNINYFDDIIKSNKSYLLLEYDKLLIFHYLLVHDKNKLLKYIDENPNLINAITSDKVTILHYICEIFEWEIFSNIFDKYLDIIDFNIYAYYNIHSYIIQVNVLQFLIVYYLRTLDNKMLNQINKLIKLYDINKYNDLFHLLSLYLLNLEDKKYKEIKDKDLYYKKIDDLIKFCINNGLNLNNPKLHLIECFFNDKYKHVFRLYLNNNIKLDMYYYYLFLKKLNNVHLKFVINNMEIFKDIKTFHGENLNTQLHIILLRDNIDLDILFHTILLNDINIRNIDNNTPLHLLLKNYDYKLFESILKEKYLDIFVKNIYGEKPIDYIKNSDLLHFLEIFKVGYIKHFGLDEYNICIKDINKVIFNEDICSKKKKKLINLIKYKNKNNIFYSSKNYDIIIFTYLVLLKRKDIIIPFKSNIMDIINNDNLLSLNRFSDENSKILKGVNVLSNYNPGLIFWINKDIYYIHPDFIFYSLKALYKTERYITYIIFQAWEGVTNRHVFCVLFNKITLTVEIFNSASSIYDIEFDKFIFNKINEVMKYYNDGIYYDKLNLVSQNSINEIQYLSKESDYLNNIGDFGFCLLWTMCYLDNRTKYVNLSMKEFFENFVESIKDSEYVEDNNKFVNYIRNYGGYLIEKKEELYKLVGLEKLNYHKKHYPKLINKLESVLRSLY